MMTLKPALSSADSTAIASKLITPSFAEKIMGEPAKLTCNIFIKKGDTLEYKCDYTALSQDEMADKTIKLYFMYEVYASAAAAENAYTFFIRPIAGMKALKLYGGWVTRHITIVTVKIFISSWLERRKKC